jgi:hypothetical protein
MGTVLVGGLGALPLRSWAKYLWQNQIQSVALLLVVLLLLTLTTAAETPMSAMAKVVVTTVTSASTLNASTLPTVEAGPALASVGSLAMAPAEGLDARRRLSATHRRRTIACQKEMVGCARRARTMRRFSKETITRAVA